MSRRRLLDWKGGDRADGPDGTQYAINSAQVRGEPRIYWVQVTLPGDNLPTVELAPEDGWPTKPKARTCAERHARSRTNP